MRVAVQSSRTAGRLPVLQAAALLPLVVVVAVFLLYLHGETLRLEQERRRAADDMAHEISVFIDLHLSGLDLAARMSAMTKSSPSAIFTATLRTHPALTAIVSTSSEGRVTLACGDKTDAAAFGEDLRDTPAFLAVRDTLHPQVSGVERDTNDPGDLMLTLSVPVIDRLGRFAGMVQGALNISDYAAAVSALGRFHDHHFVMVDSEHRVIQAPPGSGLAPLDTVPFRADGSPDLPSAHRYVARGIGGRVSVLTYEPGMSSFVVANGAVFLALLAAVGATALVVRRIAAHTRELEAARAAAESANASKSAFLAMTSHEIRTPLNAVIGLSDSLIRTSSDPRVREHLGTIRNSGELLLNVVSDLLDLSKVEAGRFELRPGPVDLQAHLRDICALFSSQAASRQLDLFLELEIPPGLVVATDPGRLRQVLVNLVGNALKFTRRGSVRLRVETVAESGPRVTLRFSVIDTGPGIPAEAQARLFEPYYRVNTPGSSSVEGTGLGLNISRRLVDLMGGSIRLRSVPGFGCEFFFELELPVLPSAPAEPAPAPAAAPAGGRLPEVLAVDDNPANREVVRALIEDRCVLSIFETAAEALAALRGKRFDIALLDLEMPGEDGFSLVRSFRQEPGSSAGCRLVAVSCHTPETMRERCLQSGFDAFISKPLRRNELLEAIAIPSLSAS